MTDTKKDFNSEEFEKKVFEELHFVENQKGILENFNRIKPPYEGILGFFAMFFWEPYGVFNEYVYQKYIVLEEHNVKFGEQAKRLLLQKRFRDFVCANLKKPEENRRYYREEVIHFLVKSFEDEDLRKKYGIELETKLFAFLTYELLQTGIAEYCEGN